MKKPAGGSTPASSKPANEPASNPAKEKIEEMSKEEETYEEFSGDIKDLITKHYEAKYVTIASRTFKKKLRFKVKPITTAMYKDIIGNLSHMLVDFGNKKEGIQLEDIEIFNYAEHYAPMIEKILPVCCLSPKFSLDGADGTISLNEFPAFEAAELMQAIFEVSGIADKEGSNKIGNL